MKNWLKRALAGLLAMVCVLGASACVIGGGTSASSSSNGAVTAPAEVTDAETGLVYKATLEGDALEVSGYVGTNSDVRIPDTYEGFPVVAVYNRAFYKNTTITHVTFGANVAEIKERAFFQCTALQTVFWGENLKIIGASAFANCSLLQVKFEEGLKELHTSAFANCYNLPPILHTATKGSTAGQIWCVIYIPTTVEVIQVGVFSGLKGNTQYPNCALWYPRRGSSWVGDFQCGLRVHPYKDLVWLG